MHVIYHQDFGDILSCVYKAKYYARGHFNPNHVHSTVVTLVIIKFLIGKWSSQIVSKWKWMF